MNPVRKVLLFLNLIVIAECVAWTCQSPNAIVTPEQIGIKKRSKIISGQNAINDIDKLHGLAVASTDNLIAEYGEQDPDLLYISYYAEKENAEEAFNTMMKKIAHNQKSPFHHLVPLAPGRTNAYFLLGMGATHYVLISGHYIIWLQTYQPLGSKLPDSITTIYPVATEQI